MSVSPPLPSAATLKTVYLRIVPLVMLAYVMNFIDRANISMVKDDLAANAGIGAAAYGLGAGLFFLTYCFLQAGAIELIHRVGARVMLGSIIFAWGFVSAAMAFVSSEWMFYVLRLLLGAVESGFYGGVLFFFTLWFPHAERAKANALFLSAAAIANIIGNPLAGLIVGMHGVGGLDGWQWVFVMEGIPSILLGVAFWVVLPSRPTKARWLSREEAERLESYIAYQDAVGAKSAGNARWYSGLKDRQVILTIVLLFSAVMGTYANGYFLPSIIQTYGDLSKLQVGLLTAIPYVLTAVVLWVAPLMIRPGAPTKFWISGSLASMVFGFVLGVIAGPVVGLVGFSIAQAGTQLVQPLLMANVSARLSGGMLVASIAMIQMIGQLGGFVAPTLMGAVEEVTGNPASGLWFVVGLAVVTTVLSSLVKMSPTMTMPVESAEGADTSADVNAHADPMAAARH